MAKERGALLTIWLILMLIANGGIALLYLLTARLLAILSPIPLLVFYLMGALALLNFIFVIFLFLWKKWAFFALCASAVVAFILNLTYSIGVVRSIIGLAGPVILFFILRPKWKLLE